MSKKAEPVKGSIPPESSVRIEPHEAVTSLEFAVQLLNESAEFAREMAARAREVTDAAAALEYDSEAAGAEAHAANLCKLVGSLKLMEALQNPRGNRAA